MAGSSIPLSHPNESETPSPWLSLAAILIGTLLGTLGNSMANLVVPAVMDEFQIPLSGSVWVVTLYTLVFSVLMPVCGDLGATFGHRRLYLTGVGLVAVASVAAGFAPSYPWLLAARVIQGIGIAPTLPGVMVLIARVFPANERGRAMGYWAFVNAAGHALGPFLSGTFIEYLSWRAVFFFFVPVSLLCVWLVWRCVPPDPPQTVRSFDPIGAGAMTVMAMGTMLTLSQGSRWGWGSVQTMALIGLTLSSLAVFWFNESKVAVPFINLSLFTNRRFTAATVIICTEAFSLFGLLLALPLYLIRVQGWTSQTAGAFTMILTVSMALIAPFAGRMADVFGSRMPCIAGASLIGFGSLVLFTGLSLHIVPSAGWVWALCLAMIGIGMGLIQSPVTSAVIQAVHPEQVGVATGVFHMSRFILGALGSTVFGLIMESTLGGIAPGFTRSMLTVVIAAGLAFLFSIRLQGVKDGSKNHVTTNPA